MLRLIDIRKDVWLESLTGDEGYENIELDLPVALDAPLVLLYSTREKVCRGIFHRFNDGPFPVLKATAIGLSELSERLFVEYAKRKTPHSTVIVSFEDDTRITGRHPSALTVYNPNLEPNDEKEGCITLSSTNTEPGAGVLIHMLEIVIENENPALIRIKNPKGCDLSGLLKYIEMQTEYLVGTREYLFIGE